MPEMELMCTDKEGVMSTVSPSSDGPLSTRINKMVPSEEALSTLSREDLMCRLLELKVYVEELEKRSGEVGSDCGDDRLAHQQLEAQRRENVLFMRLTAKEQEVQEYLSQLEELRTSLGGGLRNALLDPVVNSIFQKMREELHQTKEKLEQCQQETMAWKFTPDSTTGKKLMAKCRNLIRENGELGRMVESGRVARLEGELALSKKQTNELHAGQTEVDTFLMELDEDMEGLQTTVVFLQKQLDSARQENRHLRSLLRMGPGAEEPRTGMEWSRSSEGSSTPSLEERAGRTEPVESGEDTPKLHNGTHYPCESPPPRKMPRLDTASGYSPQSPVDCESRKEHPRTRNVDDRGIFERMGAVLENGQPSDAPERS